MSHVENFYDASSHNRKKVVPQNGTRSYHVSTASVVSECTVRAISEDMLEYVLDLSLLEEVFTEHREASLMSRYGGTHYPEASTSHSESPGRKQYDVVCPECRRSIAAVRFAPHLDKCIGMGRNSSRVARQKMQQGNQEDQPSDSHSEDDVIVSNDDDDVDWTTKRKRGAKQRNRTRKKTRKDIE
ncbi:hypothetical protein PFISCL1PPCAC_15566 [Pristionchus fissidentatus]|uniref:SAGA-associated factor 11 n=1 Tax=Pristionchus fissidentatus TaxID=1538716 RepID=A0AAV5W0P3_9BILA|nr:hypothetical protein PFISCL1PPCAC_15566 [Pristionchus fissidentatus]